jgi:hypothetical protein
VVVVVVVVVVPAASYMYMREQAAWIVSIDTFSSFSFYRPLASRCRSPPSLSVHQRVQFSSCLLLGRLRPNLPSSSPDCDGRQERHRPAPARRSWARAPPPPPPPPSLFWPLQGEDLRRLGHSAELCRRTRGIC